MPVNKKATPKKHPLTRGRKLLAERNKKIIRLSRTTAQSDIARLYGISRQRVHTILKRGK